MDQGPHTVLRKSKTFNIILTLLPVAPPIPVLTSSTYTSLQPPYTERSFFVSYVKAEGKKGESLDVSCAFFLKHRTTHGNF
jgi:hypothetical protein